MKSLVAVALFTAVSLLAGGAEAQPLRPNILFVFDTSTSMLSSTNCPTGSTGNDCDGSMTCNNRGQDSRLFRLKQAIRETLSEAGTDEANFGLARFPQQETPGTDRGCYRGHYINSVTSGASSGCKTSAATEPENGTFFTATVAREVVTVPVTRVLQAAAADFDPVGANIVNIYNWLDNQETVAGGAITDPEIRAGGGGTPLGPVLFYSRLYFERFVKPVDPRAGCRKNIVILVTDGVDTCTDNLGLPSAVTRAQQLFAAGVQLYVVVQQGEQGTIHDQIASAGSGGTRPTSIKVDFTNPTATKAELLRIIAEAVPPGEVCNGLDDNCNNLIDEPPLPNVGGACLCAGLLEAQVGIGQCKKGVFMCEGAAGVACRGCVLPAVELCNGLDDDCDGLVDEDFPDIGKACSNNQLGICKREGSYVCSADKKSLVCDAPMGAPLPGELCNNLDDDCDGMVDETPVQGEGAECSPMSTMCMKGKTKCQGGRLVCASESGMGSKEVCNAKDDDCNGLVDDGVDGVGQMCTCEGFDPTKVGKGECKPGTTICRGSEGRIVCEGCTGPKNEVCDCKDNDCNGEVDENNPCGPGYVCAGCQCHVPCGSGEFRCPTGYTCDESVMPAVCKPLKCKDVVCQAGFRCVEATGTCQDPCLGVTCQSPKTCVGGQCLDCTQLGCGASESCVAGVCKPNLCAGVKCQAGQYCTNGQCQSACAPACGTGQFCIDGVCKTDLCAADSCGGGTACDPADGQCKANKCTPDTCSAGQLCLPTSGVCVDNPCANVVCQNACYACQISSDGRGYCALRRDCSEQTVSVSSRGGGCSFGGGASGAGAFALFLGIATLGAARRRRARGGKRGREA